MKKLEGLLIKLENNIRHATLINPIVSEASVGWHIEHSLLTLNSIIDSLCKSNPDDYKHGFDIRRIVVMLTGKFPRGRIKAPRGVRPAADFHTGTLHEHIKSTRLAVKKLEQLSSRHYFKHPFLGDFKLKPAVRFMSIHTNHHLYIIEDIVRGIHKK